MDLHAPIKDSGRNFMMFAGRLEKLDIRTPWDFLLHIPFRYDDFSIISKISQIQPGETVTINGEVMEMKNQYTRRWKNIQRAKIKDETGIIDILWFNQPYLPKTINVEDKIALSGKVSIDKNILTMVSPDYELLVGSVPIHTGRLVPIYPETRGISSKWIRRQVKKFLDEIPPSFSDFLPTEVISKEKLLPLKTALLQIHFPKHLDEMERAKERLSFDELFLLQLRAKSKREEWKDEIKGIPLEIKKFEKELASFYKSLPFELTNSQNKAIEEILKDLTEKEPMNRLLQGDVGSGKTVVAMIAMYITHLNGYKSILMAPTEILAQQHFRTINDLMKPLGLKIELVTGGSKTRSKNHKSSIINHKFNEKSDIFIGTHALLHRKNIKQDDLGLVVIDEQQRFGVEQRSIIRKKGENPHFLTMTATPIPRTVALTIYGDLDVSYLSDMPLGRRVIKTWLTPNSKREDAYKWIEKEIKTNKTQAFIICPFIEESETMQTIKAATVEFERLKRNDFKNLRLELIHGKIKSKEKQKIMEDFKNKKFDILVATPLVEVGIDIPNATIIVIEAAQRFGLSQLHQLRGRVGRSDMQSYCLLFTESKGEHATARLKGMESIQNGAQLAELDLKLRGPGDIYGTMQHGMPKLKVASFSDTSLIQRANVEAEKILPELSKYPALEKELNNITSSQISPD